MNDSPPSYQLVYEGTWATNQSIAVTSILLLEDTEKSLTLIHIFLQIRQVYWCLCLIDIWHKSLLMEGTKKLRMDKYKEITNDQNYEASCTLTSLLDWDLKFEAQPQESESLT
jgi:hypothetical protein